MKKIISLLAFAFFVFSSGFSANEVTVSGALSGNGSYSTLSAAITAITAASQTNANISVAISGSTIETSTSTISNKGWSTLTIYPTVDNLTVSGTIAAGPIIFLSGAQNVTIDGRVNATGSTKSLIITNSSTATNTNTSTIRIGIDAKNNTIQYCTIKGSSMATTGGIIYFSAPSTSTNSGNLITNNDITSDAAGRPVYAILSTGTSGKSNTTSTTISYNNIYSFLNATTSSTGIYIKDYADHITIQNNNFYETNTFTTTGNQSYTLINTGATVNDCIIKDNYIGGNTAGSGTWTKTASGSGTANSLTAIFCASPSGTNTIQGNTIKGFNFTNNSGTTSIYTWTGISLAGAGNITCQNNTISSIKTSDPSGTGTANGVYGITCITKTATVGTATIQNNTIGSLTNTNDIYASGTTSASCNVQGIYYNGTATSGTSLIEGNTIANLNNASTLTTGSGTLGIYTNSSTAHTLNVNRNFIYGLSESGNSRIYGIRIGPAPSTACTVTNNIISLSPVGNSLIQGGIYHTATAVNYYYNTVYVGGSGNGESVALYNNVASGSTFKNNIFINTRTNNDATNHLAYRSTLTTTNIIDYNDFYVDNSNGAILAAIGNAPYTAKTIGGFADTNSQNVNAGFANAGGTTATDYKSSTLLSGVSGTGVNTDYSANYRGSIYQMGAFTPAYWNGTVWNFTPTTGDNAIIDGNFSDAGFSCNDLTINAGKQVTVSSGSLVISGNLLLKSDAANGTATFWDNGGTVSVVGTTSVQQYLGGGRNWYISSPVVGATTAAITSTNTPGATAPTSVVSYDETKGSGNPISPWIPESSTLLAMKGYIAVNNVATPTTDCSITFTGTLNTGSQSIVLSRTDTQMKAGFNLVGNPYPSYLDWSMVDTTKVMSTIWYRTQTSGGAYIFDTYNGGLNVSTSLGATTVTNKIPPLQAFWVRLRSGFTSGNLSFDNTMRSHVDVADNKFKVKAVQQSSILRLQVSNGINKDETLICISSNASNEYDNYDSPKMSNNNASIPEIYTTIGSEKLVINAMNNIPYDTEIPLDFVPGNGTQFTLKATERTNFEPCIQILLKDKGTGAVTDLTTNDAYIFDNSVSATGRFSLLFKSPRVTTGINSPTNDENNPNKILIYSNMNNKITVNCNDITPESSVVVYNAIGQKLIEKKLEKITTVINTISTPGVYWVVVKSGLKQVTKKIIVN